MSARAPPAPPALSPTSLRTPKALVKLMKDVSGVEADGYEQLLATPATDRDAIALYSRPYGKVPGVREFLCVGEAPVEAKTMFDVLMDAEYRLEWDGTCEKHVCLDTYPAEQNMTHSLNHWVIKYPFPLSRRDYCYERITEFVPGTDGATDEYFLVTAAATSPKVPEQSKVVRVETSKTAYSLRQIRRPDGKPMCQFVYTAVDDPKGAIPKWVITLLTTKTLPGVMKGMFEACNGYNK